MASDASLNGLDSQQRACRQFAFQSWHLYCHDCGGGEVLPDWLLTSQFVCSVCGKVAAPCPVAAQAL